MPIIYTQTIDGIQLDPPTTVAPPLPGDDLQTTINRKAQGALNTGWTIAWNAAHTQLTATKTYPAGSSYLKKVRVFELIAG